MHPTSQKIIHNGYLFICKLAAVSVQKIIIYIHMFTYKLKKSTERKEHEHNQILHSCYFSMGNVICVLGDTAFIPGSSNHWLKPLWHSSKNTAVESSEGSRVERNHRGLSHLRVKLSWEMGNIIWVWNPAGTEVSIFQIHEITNLPFWLRLILVVSLFYNYKDPEKCKKYV